MLGAYKGRFRGLKGLVCFLAGAFEIRVPFFVSSCKRGCRSLRAYQGGAPIPGQGFQGRCKVQVLHSSRGCKAYKV